MCQAIILWIKLLGLKVGWRGTPPSPMVFVFILLNGGAVIGCMCQELGGAILVSGGSLALLQVAMVGSNGERRLHGIVMVAPEAPK